MLVSDSMRMDFLDGIEAGLTPASSGDQERRSSRRGVKVAGMIGGAALASAAVLGMFGGVASASPVSSAAPATVNACSTPDPVAQSQSKWCGTANYYFAYQYTYSPNGGLVRCYAFDLTIFHAACGGTVFVGYKEACA
jgi:hypothetical protein